MKKTDELKSLRDLGADALSEKLREFENELMNLRFRKAAGQLEHSSRIRIVRRSIARARTVGAQQKPAA